MVPPLCACLCRPGEKGVNAGRAVAVLLPLSQINHAGETQQAPVHSAWGWSCARMLSVSHGPGPPLFSPLSLFLSLLGVLWMGLVVEGGVVERHNTHYSCIGFFLPSTLLFFSPFTSLSVGVKRVKQKKIEKQASISPARRQQQPLFYLPSEGPDDSSGQAQWMKRRSVWGGGGGRHTKGLATDISWKLLDDVSAHQRTATAIVGLIRRQRSRRHHTVACFSIFQCVARAKSVQQNLIVRVSWWVVFCKCDCNQCICMLNTLQPICQSMINFFLTVALSVIVTDPWCFTQMEHDPCVFGHQQCMVCHFVILK